MADGRAGQSPDRDWRKVASQNQGKPDGSSSGKARKLFTLLGILLALAGAVAALIFFPSAPSPPHFLTLPIREYRVEQWPTNPFAVQDGELLVKHFEDGKTKEAFGSQTRDRIIKELSDLPAEANQPVVVHLCAHGVCHDDKVYLIPGDAYPDKTSHWLALSEVLELLKKNPANHKLLILDIMRPLSDPRLGILDNQVATAVHNQLQEATEKNELPFLVLCACSRGEVSLVSEEMGLSVFAFFLDRGLKGKAEGFGPQGEENGHISVKELADYVSHQVSRWAKLNRHTCQTPVLLGRGADCTLTTVDSTEQEAEEEEEPEKDKSYPGWLQKGWALREDWRKQGIALQAPRPFQKLVRILLNTEERWRGGIEPDRLEKGLAQDLLTLKEQVQFAQKMPTFPPHSLATAENAPSQEKKEEDKKPEKDKKAEDKGKPAVDPDPLLKGLLLKFETGELKLTSKEDLDKTREEVKAFWEAVKEVPPAKTMRVIFARLSRGTKLSVQNARLAHELFSANPSQLSLVEPFLFHRLENLRIKKVENKGWPWPELAGSQVLRTTQLAEQAVARLQEVPYALPWVKDQFGKADAKRRQAETILFEHPFPEWPEAQTLFSEAEQEYRQILEQIAILQRAQETLGQALVDLPSYVPCFIAEPEPDPDQKREWENALRETISLSQLLRNPDPDSIDEVADTQIFLKGPLVRLHSTFQDKRRALLNEENPSPTTYLELQAFLKSPLLSSSQRVDIWRKARELGKSLHQKALADESDENGPRIPKVSQEDVSERNQEQTARQAYFSIQLLKLAELDTSSLQENWRDLASQKQSAEWHFLAADLHKHWSRELPAQFQMAQNNLTRASQLSHLPFYYDEPQEWNRLQPHWSHVPTAFRNRNRYDDYWRWLGNRYQAESDALPKNSPARQFFTDLAEKFSG